MSETFELLSESIRIQAGAFNLPVDLIEAIVSVESRRQRNAVRHEAGYRYLWNVAEGVPYRLSAEQTKSASAPPGFPHWGAISSRDTEYVCQRISWGPMQIMGATAREIGFNGRFPDLCGPLGVRYGCKYLASLRDRYIGPYGWDGVIAAYNAGSPRKTGGRFKNQHYINKVRKAGWSGA